VTLIGYRKLQLWVFPTETNLTTLPNVGSLQDNAAIYDCASYIRSGSVTDTSGNIRDVG
jgi:hypothetical protein